VEVMGFEPTASTLRTSMSQPFDHGLHAGFPGRGLSIPSRSLKTPPPSLSIGSRKITLFTPSPYGSDVGPFDELVEWTRSRERWLRNTFDG
jgi:hypothetical protein